MTVSEMADETGCNNPLIKRICDDNGWKPMTISERMKEFIEANQHLTLDEQAEKAGMSINGLKHHYEVNDIPLPEKKKKNGSFVAEEKQEERVPEIKSKIRKRKPIDRKSFTSYAQSSSDLLE